MEGELQPRRLGLSGPMDDIASVTLSQGSNDVKHDAFHLVLGVVSLARAASRGGLDELKES
jgi:hypothetical protein